METMDAYEELNFGHGPTGPTGPTRGGDDEYEFVYEEDEEEEEGDAASTGQASLGDMEALHPPKGLVAYINIGKCAFTGAQKGLEKVCQVKITELPKIRKIEAGDPVTLSCDKDTFLAMLTLSHDYLKGSGFIVIRLPKPTIKRLIASGNLKKFTAISEVEKVCPELCKAIAENFKADINQMGMGALTIGPTSTISDYYEGQIKDVKVSSIFIIDVIYQKDIFLTIEIAFQSHGGH